MKHPLDLSTPLPPGTLRLSAMSARCGVGVLDEIELDLLSEKPDVAAEDLLGKPVDVSVALRDAAEGIGAAGQRHLCGIVSRFGLGRPVASSAGSRLFAYSASVRPWLWLLTRTADCRIFQDLTVPQIVEKVFADFPAANFKFKLVRSYRTRVYCVQYRESDFNFVARLLEEEGIWWFFEHTEGAHQLVLVDDVASSCAVPGCEVLPYFGTLGAGAAPDVPHVSSWSFSREVQTGKTVLQSYDFERPSTSLLAEAALVREHGEAEHEQFDYEGESYLKPDGAQRVQNRVDELQSRHERLAGSTNAQTLAAGYTFELDRHPRADQNTNYLCLETRITAQATAFEAGEGAGEHWACAFTAAPASHPYRAPRRTPKPFVQGPQTAVVVGPAGDEIFTDKYGRVKVQFHWDRYGQKNEKSSCWVRVSSPWAGKSFGFVQLPRIGQEVIVDFLEGDPDQPIITGRVYNAEQMPPWELPANATQSGWLTRSSKTGAYTNANAIRFEDKKGAEQLWLHAEKNQDIEVENDETHWVGHDRKKTVDNDETVHVKHDRTETVGNDETITVKRNRNESVDVDEDIRIGEDRTEQVGGDESITIDRNRVNRIGKNHQETIGANHKLKIGKSQSIKIGRNLTETVSMLSIQNVGMAKMTNVGLGYMLNVGAAYSINTGGLLNVVVGAAYNEQVAKSRSITAGDNASFSAGKTLSITGEQKLTHKGKEVFIEGSTKLVIAVGASTITMTPGEISINSPLVKINCPSTSSSALAASPDGGTTASGLGKPVDDIAGKSPALQKDLAALKKDGWKVEYGAAGGGSFADRATKTITIDGALAGNPAVATQTLAHEVGHARYPFAADMSSRASYLQGTLADEGAATMNNIKVQREIIANGGPDIGIAGNTSNHAAYNRAYDTFLKDGDAASARNTMGSIFGHGERTSTTGQTYADYYGSWYDRTRPPPK